MKKLVTLGVRHDQQANLESATFPSSFLLYYYYVVCLQVVCTPGLFLLFESWQDTQQISMKFYECVRHDPKNNYLN